MHPFRKLLKYLNESFVTFIAVYRVIQDFDYAAKTDKLDYIELASGHNIKCNLERRTNMGYTNVALKEKIMEMYPDISKYAISVGLDFDQGKNAYIVKFKKDRHELTTHLEKKDADDCMDGIKCVYLGVQVGQFIKNFEILEKE